VSKRAQLKKRGPYAGYRAAPPFKKIVMHPCKQKEREKKNNKTKNFHVNIYR